MQQTADATNVIKLPGKYALTETGIQYFSRRQIPLRDLRMRDGRRAMGLYWERYEPEHVNRLIAYELLEEIEIERTEFLSHRVDIMSLTLQTVTGILQKHFRLELKQVIRNSRVLAPFRDRVAKVSPEQMQAYVRKNSRTIRLRKRELAYHTIQSMKRETDGDKEHRKERIGHIRRIIRGIDSETWFLLSLLPDGEGREELMRVARDLVAAYAARFVVVDYVALMLMELLEYAEQTQVWDFAERDQYIRTHPEQLASRLSEPHFRAKLFQRAEESGSYLTLNYHFSENPLNAKQPPQMQVTVTNRGLVGYESRREILSMPVRNIRHIPLAEFYDSEDPSRIDTTLGMHYFSYVREACREVGMKFEAEIVRDERMEETNTRVRLWL